MRLKQLYTPLLSGLTGIALLSATGSAWADYALNMTQGVTPISERIYGLHMTILWICVVIGIGVFGMMIYSMINHRKSKGAEPAKFHESTAIEVIWTIVPFLVLVAIAVPATKALIDLEDTSKADINIQVTGIQWKWRYKYLDENIEFISSLAQSSREAVNGDPTNVENYLLEVDKPIVVPVNKKIRFLFNSDDVIHAWWVPELAVKQDAIPGFINDSWATITKPGIYRGQCAELCGKDHGFMPIVVHAVSDEEYTKWVGEQKAASAAVAASADKVWTKEDLVAKGQEVYNASCMACHQAQGQGIPGVFPAITNSPLVLGPIAGHMDIVMNGKAGTAMQAFKTQLSDVDLAAVITFQRNSLGNSVGDMVQPSDIKKAR